MFTLASLPALGFFWFGVVGLLAVAVGGLVWLAKKWIG